MTSSAITVVLLFIGGLCLFTKDVGKKPKLKYFFSVLAIVVLLGAGVTILAVPLLGDFLTALTSWGKSGIWGGVIIGMFGFGLTWILVLAAMPDEFFSYDPPDWVAYAGALIPTFSVSFPGELGQRFADFIMVIAEASNNIGSGGFGGQAAGAHQAILGVASLVLT